MLHVDEAVFVSKQYLKHAKDVFNPRIKTRIQTYLSIILKLLNSTHYSLGAIIRPS